MKISKSMKVMVIGMFFSILSGLFSPVSAVSDDLEAIRQQGFLRHLGVPYANFITGSGDGFSVELIQSFADYLGVEYRFVKTSWSEVIGHLTGKQFTVKDGKVTVTGACAIQGDLISNGLTELDWRKELLAYSNPTFQTQVWLLTRADASLKPITPGDNVETDIAAVKAKLSGLSVLGVSGTCIDPRLYHFANYDAEIIFYQGNLNELAPAVMSGLAESTLLDVPDTLVALQKWPDAFKVIGPVTRVQNMGVGFRKEGLQLREQFNAFLKKFRKSGHYLQLVQKYYPTAIYYFGDFFKK